MTRVWKLRPMARMSRLLGFAGSAQSTVLENLLDKVSELMKIYSLSSNEENIGIQLASSGNGRVQNGLWFGDAKALLESWKPVSIETRWYGHYDKQKKKLVDFPNHGFGCLVVSDRAKNLLNDSLSKHGEFLPLNSSEGKFWAFHALNCIDAIDQKKSTPLYGEYRNNRPCGSPISITTPYAFHCERLVDELVFCVPNLRGFFFTEKFVNLVSDLQLTGLSYRLEFDSELHKNGFDYLGEPLGK